MRDYIPRVLEPCAGMKQVVKIKYVMVDRGRWPHGCLHSKTH